MGYIDEPRCTFYQKTNRVKGIKLWFYRYKILFLLSIEFINLKERKQYVQ